MPFLDLHNVTLRVSCIWRILPVIRPLLIRSPFFYPHVYKLLPVISGKCRYISMVSVKTSCSLKLEHCTGRTQQTCIYGSHMGYPVWGCPDGSQLDPNFHYLFYLIILYTWDPCGTQLHFLYGSYMGAHIGPIWTHIDC